MGRRRILTLTHDGREVAVFRDNEWDEFVVRLKGNPDADYFTSDKEDAVATAHAMVKPQQPRSELGSHEWRRRFRKGRRGTFEQRHYSRRPGVELIDHEAARGVRVPRGYHLRMCTRTKRAALATRKQNGWQRIDKIARRRLKSGRVAYCLFTRD